MTDAKEQAKAVGHIPSGLFVITTKEGDQIDGYLASWVQQVSFSPLVVALAVSPSRPGYETLVSGKTFSINIVGDHETQYMRHFWSGYPPEKNPFKNGELDFDVTEADAVRIAGAKSVIECKFLSKAQPGDHEVVFAEVTRSHILDEDAKPKVHIRKTGLDY